jgi:O-antigen/teichoic acid export membrane protein
MSLTKPKPLGGLPLRPTLLAEPVHRRIVAGSMTMLLGSGLVGVVNLAYNVALARMLGPVGFGHTAAALTMLMLVSAITLPFQLVCAKSLARCEDVGARAGAYSVLWHRAWLVGICLGTSLIIFRNPVTSYLRLPSAWVVVLLALGIALYIPLGVKRGGLQGICAFSRLTTNLIVEGLAKFIGAIVLVDLGYGVIGAVAAIAGSVAVAHFVPLTVPELKARSSSYAPISAREGIQALVFFVGQVIVNNVDILLVKHFFDTEEAGLYAAVALVGRVVFHVSWSVVTVMFPISADAKTQEQDTSVLVVPLLLVLSIVFVFVAGLGLLPDSALSVLLGSAFRQPGHTLDSLLMLYAAVAGVYSLSVVLMTYQMSRKLDNGGWLQLAFSGAITVGIGFFHNTLRQIVIVQLLLVGILLIMTSSPLFRHLSCERRIEEVA